MRWPGDLNLLVKNIPGELTDSMLEQMIDAGRRVRTIGEQVGDVADTAAKTRKKHK